MSQSQKPMTTRPTLRSDSGRQLTIGKPHNNRPYARQPPLPKHCPFKTQSSLRYTSIPLVEQFWGSRKGNGIAARNAEANKFEWCAMLPQRRSTLLHKVIAFLWFSRESPIVRQTLKKKTKFDSHHITAQNCGVQFCYEYILRTCVSDPQAK